MKTVQEEFHIRSDYKIACIKDRKKDAEPKMNIK